MPKGMPTVTWLLYTHHPVGFSQPALFEWSMNNNAKQFSKLPKLEHQKGAKSHVWLAPQLKLWGWTLKENVFLNHLQPGNCQKLLGMRCSPLRGTIFSRFAHLKASATELRILFYWVFAIVGTFRTAGPFTKQILAWDMITKRDSCGVGLPCSLIWGQYWANGSGRKGAFVRSFGDSYQKRTLLMRTPQPCWGA